MTQPPQRPNPGLQVNFATSVAVADKPLLVSYEITPDPENQYCYRIAIYGDSESIKNKTSLITMTVDRPRKDPLVVTGPTVIKAPRVIRFLIEKCRRYGVNVGSEIFDAFRWWFRNESLEFAPDEIAAMKAIVDAYF